MEEKKKLDIGISKYSREKVIDHLKYSFSHDHLEEVDFEKRLIIAVNTHDKNDLKALVEDLPAIKEEKKDKQGVSPELSINTGTIKEKSMIVSILGGAERKGVWKPAKILNVYVALGGADINFTQAVFPPGVTEINIFCVMGGVDIIVPHGLNVDNQCIAIMGGVDDESIQSENPGSPTLRIKGLVFMGGLEIKTPKEGLMKRILKKLGID